MRELDVPCEVDFMAVPSYGSSTDSSGVVRILKDLDAPLEGRNVLIVEDIVDSGLTLQYLMRTLEARNPASIEVCALLTKPERRKVELPSATLASRSPTSSPSGTGSTTPSATGTCRMSRLGPSRLGIRADWRSIGTATTLAASGPLSPLVALTHLSSSFTSARGCAP